VTVVEKHKMYLAWVSGSQGLLK